MKTSPMSFDRQVYKENVIYTDNPIKTDNMQIDPNTLTSKDGHPHVLTRWLPPYHHKMAIPTLSQDGHHK